VRGGSYIEPTRFDGSETASTQPLVSISSSPFGTSSVSGPNDYMWRCRPGGDAARNYRLGVTIAGWYPRHTSRKTCRTSRQGRGFSSNLAEWSDVDWDSPFVEAGDRANIASRGARRLRAAQPRSWRPSLEDETMTSITGSGDAPSSLRVCGLRRARDGEQRQARASRGTNLRHGWGNSGARGTRSCGFGAPVCAAAGEAVQGLQL
jgi:hypothetical protein